jgi:hypothetical protein
MRGEGAITHAALALRRNVARAAIFGYADRMIPEKWSTGLFARVRIRNGVVGEARRKTN